MTYYIRIPGTKPDIYLNSAFTLGEVSFKSFWPDDGFDRLKKIINDESPEAKEFLNNDVTVIDQTGKVYSVDEFLSILGTLNIKQR